MCLPYRVRARGHFGLLRSLSGRCISVSSNTRSRLEQRAARMEYEGDDDPGI
jgi:hypothetical protein